jgi:dihydrofolate synthase/folylpolyglutamate synthase
VIEAGLGGRWDATNVIPSKVSVLTSVGLEHTRWLGPTVADIAAEKLAVVRDLSTLVVGPLPDEASAVVEEVVSARHARLVRAPLAPGSFQRQNFAVASAAAEAFLGSPLDASAVARAAAEVRVPGRLEVVSSDGPLVLYDGAHNPAGAEALAAALPEVVGSRRLVGVIGVLDDKDAAAMLRELLPHAARLVLTANANPRALSPGTLESLARQLGAVDTLVEPDPHRAVELARERARGEGGVVLATGSIYLIADLLRPAGARGATL